MGPWCRKYLRRSQWWSNTASWRWQGTSSRRAFPRKCPTPIWTSTSRESTSWWDRKSLCWARWDRTERRWLAARSGTCWRTAPMQGRERRRRRGRSERPGERSQSLWTSSGLFGGSTCTSRRNPVQTLLFLSLLQFQYKQTIKSCTLKYKLNKW